MLYPRLLKNDFDLLPPALRQFHTAPGGGRATGAVTVRHFNRFLARILRFPPAGDSMPAWLSVETNGEREIWVRRFGGRVLRSVQRAAGDLLVESAGPVRLYFAIAATPSGMRFETRRAIFLGCVPLPLRVQAEARGAESSWRFQVTIPWVGSYSGEMMLER